MTGGHNIMTRVSCIFKKMVGRVNCFYYSGICCLLSWKDSIFISFELSFVTMEDYAVRTIRLEILEVPKLETCSATFAEVLLKGQIVGQSNNFKDTEIFTSWKETAKREHISWSETPPVLTEIFQHHFTCKQWQGDVLITNSYKDLVMKKINFSALSFDECFCCSCLCIIESRTHARACNFFCIWMSYLSWYLYAFVVLFLVLFFTFSMLLRLTY